IDDYFAIGGVALEVSDERCAVHGDLFDPPGGLLQHIGWAGNAGSKGRPRVWRGLRVGRCAKQQRAECKTDQRGKSRAHESLPPGRQGDGMPSKLTLATVGLRVLLHHLENVPQVASLRAGVVALGIAGHLVSRVGIDRFASVCPLLAAVFTHHHAPGPMVVLTPGGQRQPGPGALPIAARLEGGIAIEGIERLALGIDVQQLAADFGRRYVVRRERPVLGEARSAYDERQRSRCRYESSSPHGPSPCYQGSIVSVLPHFTPRRAA